MKQARHRRYGFRSQNVFTSKKPIRKFPKIPKLGKVGHILAQILVWPWKILFKFKKIAFFGLVIAVLGLIGYGFFVSRDLPNPDELRNRQPALSTKIYDRTGQTLLYEDYEEEKRVLIRYEEIPKGIINGVVATEDKKFFTHWGVRPLSVARALVIGIIRWERPRGTSTLTQQLVKNVILSDDKTYTRKLKEAILSFSLERKYTKEEILQIYFNEVPYGSTVYGLSAAAETFFGKKLSELTLGEQAALAGMPQQPSTFLRNPERFKTRRDFVLRRMHEEGYISEEEKLAAQAEELVVRPPRHSIKAPHFVFFVLDALAKEFGEDELARGGFSVITTLDINLQNLAEDSMKDDAAFADAGANSAALISLNPKTGEILAMVGSRDYSSSTIDGNFNIAVDGRRQPGSSIKPIFYAAAFARGYTPETVLFDVVTNFALDGKEYKPQNYNLKEHGLVTLRKALQGSLNIPAVKVLYLVGIEEAKKFAKNLGYNTFDVGDFGLSLVLGGGEVSMLEHAEAYAVFANDGQKIPPTAILKIIDREENTIFTYTPPEPIEVVDKNVAATLNEVLSDDAARAYVFGTGGTLTLPDRPVAAKTGTTQAYRDAWTIGYTPSLVAVVWAGNHNNKPMKDGFGGGRVAGKIWNSFMRNATKDMPVENFSTPTKSTSTKPILNGSDRGAIAKINRVTGRLASSSTPEHLIVERSFVPPHDILHYVKKSDPLGPAPTEPSEDQQYAVWEAALTDWINREKTKNPNWDVSFEEPPTEFDDIYSLELVPTIEMIEPLPGVSLSQRILPVRFTATAPRGIAKVTYRINSRFITEETSFPFTTDLKLNGIEDGAYRLEIIAEDDLGNRAITEIPFLLSAGVEPPSARLFQEGGVISVNDFPKIFSGQVFKLEEISEILIEIKNLSTNQIETKTIPNSPENFIQNIFVFNWAAATTGNYEIKTTVRPKNGPETSETIFLTVQ